jgi:hypothetical protein
VKMMGWPIRESPPAVMLTGSWLPEDREHARWLRGSGRPRFEGKRTTDERTTFNPNTQPGLPSKDHRWKLSPLGTLPASLRCALSPRPGPLHNRSNHCDELQTTAMSYYMSL